jgi:hypothetical protein
MFALLRYRLAVSSIKIARLLWVRGEKYNAKILTGSFRLHTGPSDFILANFGTRPIADNCFASGPLSMLTVLRLKRAFPLLSINKPSLFKDLVILEPEQNR